MRKSNSNGGDVKASSGRPRLAAKPDYSTRTVPLTPGAQENIITLLATSDKHCQLVRTSIPLSLYTNRCARTIASAAYTYIDEHKRAPGDHLPDLLEEELNKDDDVEARLLRRYLANIAALADNSSFNESFVLAQIRGWKRQQQVKLTILDAVAAIDESDYRTAEKLFAQYRVQETDGQSIAAPTLREFFAMDIPTATPRCGAWLRGDTFAQIFAEPGAGKTFFTRHIAWCLAGGLPFPGLNWEVPEPCKVLYLDGEMPGSEMKDRWGAIKRTLPSDVAFDNVRYINVNLECDAEGVPLPTPNLADEEGIAWVEQRLGDAKVLIIDNLSTLYTTAEGENADVHWNALNGWARSLRARGIAVIVIHHPPKDVRRGGSGHSKQRRNLDIEIWLEKVPAENGEAQGLNVNVHFRKCRYKPDEQQRTYRWSVTSASGLRLSYEAAPLADTIKKQAFRLLGEGVTTANLERELGISRSTVFRYAREFKET